MTLVFLAIFVAGLLGVLLTLVISHFVGSGDGDGPPLRLLVQGSAIAGGGAGGLIASLAGLDDVGMAIAAIVCAGAVLAVIYGLVLPYLRKQRSKSQANDPARSSDEFPV